MSMKLAALGMLLSVAAGAAPTSAVTVVNTTANPVPTVAQGTTAVSGSVTVSGTVSVGNIPANQAVTVTNLPAIQAVSVNNFPANQTVSVANSAAAPVQVADVERMARVPYQSAVYHNDCTPGPGVCFFFFAGPPAGTRLVAENLSGYFQIAPGTTTPIVGYVEDGAPSFRVFTGLIANTAGLDAGGHTQAAFSQPTRFYVDGGDSVFAVVSTNWSNGASTVVLTGYLENCSLTGCPAIAR